MKKALILTLAALAIFMISCSPEGDKEGKAVVAGKYLQAEQMVYLTKVHARSMRMIDSTNLSEHPEFTFQFNSADYALYRLETDGLYPLILVMKNGDTALVEQTEDPAWPYRVSGNSETMLLVKYLEKLNRDQYRVDSLSKVFHASKSHPDFVTIREQLNQEYISLRDAHKQWAIEFILKQPASFASLVMINGFFMEELLFNTREDFAYYDIVAQAVLEKMPENKYASDLNEQVLRIREANEYEAAATERLSPGRKVPEFKLKTIEGWQASPQQFLGRELLIYFWAAGDAVSRQTNPMIREIHQAYNPLGMEVMAISFDQSGELWKAAIKLDSLPGVHISDASGAKSPLHKLFNIKMQLPTYFLIDKEGRIYDHSRDFNKLPQSVYDLFFEPIEY